MQCEQNFGSAFLLEVTAFQFKVVGTSESYFQSINPCLINHLIDISSPVEFTCPNIATTLTDADQIQVQSDIASYYSSYAGCDP